jgi:hypothetical protein
MIFELIFVLSILFVGCALILITGLKGWPLLGVGFAAGIAVYIIVGTIQVITALPTTPVLTTGINFTVLVACCICYYISGRNISIKSIPAFIYLFIFIVASVLLSKVLSVTPDSFEYIAIGSLIESGNFSEASSSLLLTRLIAIPLIHAPANLIGNFYLRSITPLLAFSTLICLGWLSYEGFKNFSNDLRISYLFSSVAVFLLLTNNRFVFNAFYINGHMLTALYVLLLIGCGWLMIRNADVPVQTLMTLIILSIPVLIVSRPEASLFVTISLIPILISQQVSWVKRALILVVLGISILAWYGFLWIKFSGEGEAVPLSVIAMSGLGLAALMTTPILSWRRIDRLLRYSTVASESGLWLVLLVLAYRNPLPLRISISATIENVILDAGGWGVSLVLIGFIGIAVLIVTKLPDRLILRFPLTTFIPLSFILAYLREGAYRVGHGDSLNRMFLHILPLAVLFIVLSAASQHRSIPKELKRGWNKLVSVMKGSR